jgi:hypothetical protein
MNDTNPTIPRLEEQIEWYDTKSQHNQWWHKLLRISEIVSGGLITLGAGFQWSYVVIGSLGFFIILLEGIQSVWQFHHHWISYRATCEYLRKEQSLFHAKAGPYRDLVEPEKVLAERIEELISHEHAKWIRGQQKTKDDCKKRE